MHIAGDITSMIGNTPLVELGNIEKKYALRAKLFAKCEFMNPVGSAKDRIALNMIARAEENGLLPPGGTVIEPTSGNTGIGIAAICAAKGYKAIIIMPDSMSVERCRLIRAFGAQLILTEGKLGMNGAVAKAEELKNSIPGSIIAGQFVNPANPEAHYLTTGPEIWRDTDGKIDIFVAGVGSGGTISGTGKYLKEKNADIRIAAVEPFESPLLSEGKAGPHGIQGIGANFVPEALDKSVIDEVITVKSADAMECGREIARTEGLLCGISSGAALKAAVELASRDENAGKNIVVVLPDTGERYLSSEMFQ
ncbi:MAG: cysteine synthase A [Clostridia bacterium]|nr:cysteine synthase A [Clostridia bacterium]